MTNTAKFWNKHAEGYAKRPVGDEAAYERKLALTRARLTPGMEVLEFGCGTGTTALHHAPHVAHIRAVDISPKMLEIARHKAEAASVGNITFEVADFDSLEAEDGNYDLVMAHSILHLLRDRRAAIAKAVRLLKPGGLFISSTPCLAGGRLGWLRFVLPPARWLGLVPWVGFFTAETLIADFEAAGLEIEESWHPGPAKALFGIARKQ
ncbi:class I SAM-dependent methyltransferase [Nisaea nitritireducens]|uniref:class I SAM-dependent methyltransferase n=1 Tax=Nisaea nitritireducens TaxID=568392 RepID=UPI001D02F78E|nr:class I SAM-dependent methyltransferase [Nisaea nitritireducens]